MVELDKKSGKFNKFKGNKRKFDWDNNNPNKEPKRESEITMVEGRYVG